MRARIETVSTPVRVDDDGEGFSFGIKWFLRPVLHESPYPAVEPSGPVLAEPPEPDETEEVVPSPYVHEPYFGAIAADGEDDEKSPYDSPFWTLGLLGPNGDTVVPPPEVFRSVDFALDGLLCRQVW